MATQYNLAPVFHIVFRDALGAPAINGTVETFQATSHVTPKAIYEDKAGTTPFPNPVNLNAAGVVADATGAPKPIYWASDENYYVVIRNAAGAIIQTVDNYQAPVNEIPTPQVDEVDFKNYVLNSQFTYYTKSKWDATELTAATEVDLGNNLWKFIRDNTNTTTILEFNTFILGQLDVPNTPKNYIEVDCTAVGGGGETIKDLRQNIGGVEALNGENISFALFGKAQAINPAGFNVEIIARQYFGSSLAASAVVETVLDTFTLTTDWVKYEFEGKTIASIAGKVLDNTANYVQLIIRLPRNEISLVSLCNIQLNKGDVLLEYDYKGENYDRIDINSIQLPDIPLESPNYGYRSLEINGDRIIVVRGGVVPVGLTGEWFKETPPDGWLLVEGQALFRFQYPALYDYLENHFGVPIYGTTATVLTDTITVTNNSNGDVTDAVDVSTGFTIVVTQQGTAGLPEIFTCQCLAASTLSGGEYFTFSTAGTGAVTVDVVYFINNSGILPTTGNEQVIVYLNSYDDNSIVASKTQLVINDLYFKMPNLKGLFSRCWANGSGEDPDRASRTDRGDGTTGDHVGTLQSHQLYSHNHSTVTYGGLVPALLSGADPAWYSTAGTVTGSTGGNETRPRNMYVAKVMKY